LYLDIGRNRLAGREDLGINLGTHETCAGSSASNQIDPDGRPSISVLKGTNS
jgi:hypothetical protein